MSTVYLVPVCAGEPAERLATAVETLWQRANLGSAFEPHDLAALKLHVGEPGTRTYVRPVIVRSLVRCISAAGARPFLTDTSVLYRSARDNAVDHARVAHEHGFGLDQVGAPFVPADGLIGNHEVEITVNARHFREVSIAAGVLEARSMLVLSHATGHLGTGLGGAIKNLGMGCASRKAKLRQHHGQNPRIHPGACVACGVCAEWCPEDAIVVDEVALIDSDRCIGCGECVARCLEGAVGFDWSIMGAELQERVVEHAAALVRSKPGRIAYVTVAQQVTKNCDCLGRDEQPLLPDIGILASFDPVAIDQAVLDLVQANAGRTLESMSYPHNDATVQLRYAEELGLGERSVELVEIDGEPGSG